MTLDDTPALNEAQQQVLELLGAGPGERPVFPDRLGATLRAQLEDELADLQDGLPEGETLWIGKRQLGLVHGCEARYLAEEASDSFAWSTATARGAVAHKAVELSVAWRGEPEPLELVEEAVARLIASTDSVGQWLATLAEGELAEIKAAANERVATFLECFPRLDKRWRPVTESRVRVDLAGDRVVLAGKVDLTLGRARGSEAGKVLVDLKTGGRSGEHRNDLRYYALLETVRLGTPPRLLASFYLDAGQAEPEPVTEDLLQAALARAVDGARRMVELAHHDHPPTKRPGPACRWCPALDDCDEGRAHLAQRAEDAGLDVRLDTVDET